MTIKQKKSILLFLFLAILSLGIAVFFLLNHDIFDSQYLTQRKAQNSIQEKPSRVNTTLEKISIEEQIKALTVEVAIEEGAIQEEVIKEEIKEEVIKIPLSFQEQLAIQAELRLQSDVTYDGSYHKIAYPMGDVPEHIGVCTDVVIRSYRALGIDLQERVHEDMKQNFRRYPNKWNLKRPDSNIDHRRVPNLMTYFERSGGALDISKDPFDYKTGNVVTWDLGRGLVHIGIVSQYVSEKTGNPLIIHNIGAGPEMNDILFQYKITGHYKYASLDSLGVRER